MRAFNDAVSLIESASVECKYKRLEAEPVFIILCSIGRAGELTKLC